MREVCRLSRLPLDGVVKVPHDYLQVKGEHLMRRARSTRSVRRFSGVTK